MEATLRGIYAVHMFLLTNPKEGQDLTEVQLISYGLIKLPNTGGLYYKAIERWSTKDIVNRRMWVKFKTHMIEGFEKILKAGGGTTMS